MATESGSSRLCHAELGSASRCSADRKDMTKQYYVYILTNKSNRVLYVGVTNNLGRRMYEHKNKMIAGFTNKYNVTKLVYFEATSDVKSVIEREKQLKNWHRDWKINLVKGFNPGWKDLSGDGEIRAPEIRDPEINSG